VLLWVHLLRSSAVQQPLNSLGIASGTEYTQCCFYYFVASVFTFRNRCETFRDQRLRLVIVSGFFYGFYRRLIERREALVRRNYFNALFQFRDRVVEPV